MNSEVYDVAVVGGGPAGMMAAGRAAELGARVVLIEKNAKLGKKLLITGGGRCNITNAELDVRKMVSKYGQKGKALFGSFSRFGVQDTIDFFTTHGLALKVEAEKRAFPVSNKAEDVWKTMVAYLKKGDVEIFYNMPCLNLRFAKDRITAVVCKDRNISAKNYIFATGGKSRPETGSTGEGFDFLKKVGHTIHESDPALVPIKIHEQWVKKLSGVAFGNVGLSVFQDGKKQERRVGKILLTHFGISGPLALNMSRNISELHKYASVQLQLDLYPDLDEVALDKQVLDIFGNYLNKRVKNGMGDLFPPKMVGPLLSLAQVDPEKEINTVTRMERVRIVKILKAIPMTVSGFLGTEKAVVTSGGVSLKEIEFKSMRSKLYQNLFLAGDILDFDRPTGGFSLQICWTTGYLAGENAVPANEPRAL